jgi:hypothetical protein
MPPRLPGRSGASAVALLLDDGETAACRGKPETAPALAPIPALEGLPDIVNVEPQLLVKRARR